MTKKAVYLHSFVPLLPDYKKNQSELIDWTLKAHEKSGGTDLVRLRRFCLSDKLIETRMFDCPDVNDDWQNHAIYHLTEETPRGADLLKRNLFFKNQAEKNFLRFYQDEKIYPSHLIHVSCTGYVSPSAPQVYFSTKEKAPDITHAYHMGCYASLPSVRMANALAQDNISVDLVHTEICSLHLDPSLHNPEQMVVQTLFADGHIKYSASVNPLGPSFKILGIKEKLIPNSLDDMTWIPSSFGMKMTLSKEVPSKIRDYIKNFVHELCLQCGIDEEHLLKHGLFAVHPGGPKIIDSVAEILSLRPAQIEASSHILKSRGNMSSATLPHVWERLLGSSLEKGTLVLSLAFGPGLTIFGSIFEVEA